MSLCIGIRLSHGAADAAWPEELLFALEEGVAMRLPCTSRTTGAPYTFPEASIACAEVSLQIIPGPETDVAGPDECLTVGLALASVLIGVAPTGCAADAA